MIGGAGVEFWHWWALAALLVTIEAFAPGFVFGWLGFAAALTGVLLLLVPGLGWQAQLLAFAVLAVADLVVWYLWFRRKAAGGTKSGQRLNHGAARYVGRRCTVVEPIENGRGRIRVGDGSWVAVGPDAPAGARVRVVGVDGTALRVEPDEPAGEEAAAGRAA